MTEQKGPAGEFLSLPEEYAPLPKEELPREYAPLPPEYGYAGSGRTLGEEQGFSAPRKPDADVLQRRHDRIKQFFLMPVAATVAAVAVLFAAVSYDPLGSDLFNSGSSSSSVSTGADAAFPSLTNLSPNGFVPGWGVLDEQFIRLEYSATSVDYLEAGLSYTSAGVTTSTVPGISYDASRNTIVLNNFTGACALNINLMGNGLKLELNGTNTLDHLLVWGFFYGGSLTITGPGTLTVNPNQTYDYGIYLKGENSQTCLMIDNTVQVEAYGAVAAVYVEDTTMIQGVYYLSPSAVAGGDRTVLPSDVAGCYGYSFTDPADGALSKHIIFIP